jgi:simple sugar transport system permease protein
LIDFLFLQNVLAGAVRSGTSVLYGTLGEVVSERAGIVNLGIEGEMLMGACVGVIVAVRAGSPALGILAGGLAGGLASLVHAFLVITRRANQLASGLALNFLVLGVTSLIGAPYVSAKIEGLKPLPIPVLSDLPFLGPILFQHDILTYVAYGLGPLLWAVLYFTRPGLGLRASGENATVAFATGWRPWLWQYGAVFTGGILAGLGGVQLTLAYTNTWIEGVTAGRGFIAVALVIFAMWHPLRAIVGAFLFGGAVALQLRLQTIGVPISAFYLDMVPYLLTLAVLIAWGRTSRRAMPEGLKEVFQTSA